MRRKLKDFRKVNQKINCGRGNNKNLTTTRIWSNTLDKWRKFAQEESPFSESLSIPEALDLGINKLNKQIEKRLKLKESIEF